MLNTNRAIAIIFVDFGGRVKAHSSRAPQGTRAEYRLSVRNKTLYSYWMPIASFVGDVMYLRRQNSTNTTNRHIAVAREAARQRGVKMITCPEVPSAGSADYEIETVHKRNIDVLRDEVESTKAAAPRARESWSRNFKYGRYLDAVRNLREYAKSAGMADAVADVHFLSPDRVFKPAQIAVCALDGYPLDEVYREALEDNRGH